MKNKILLPLTLGALVSVAQLSAAPQIASGAYAGVAAGVSVLGGKSELTLSNNGGAGAQIVQNQGNFSLAKTSAAATLFGGYGAKISGFWLAGELFYQLDSLKDKQELKLGGAPSNLKSSSTGTYGASVHLGFVPSENCVAYAILGVEARKFKVNFSTVDTDDNSAVINKKYTSLAFAPGVGARFAVTKNISIRTEYKYAMHRSKKLTGSAANSAAPAQTDQVTIKHQPKVHSFNVGVVYSF